MARVKLSTRLLAGFALILLCTVFLGVEGIRCIDRLARMTSDIFIHPFTVMTTILDVKGDMLLNQRLTTQLVHNGSAADLDRYETELSARMAEVDRKLALVGERFLGRPSEVEDIKRELALWRRGRVETLQLLRQGRRAEALALNDGRDAAQGEVVFREVADVLAFSTDKAASLRALAGQESADAIREITGALLLIMVGGIALTVLITRSVGRSLRFAVAEVEKVIAGCVEKARVAEAIAKGNLDLEITPMTPLALEVQALPRDELGSMLKSAADLSHVQAALAESFRNMAHALRLAREKELAIDWLKSGLNELNDCLRGELSVHQLATRALNYLAGRVRAGVGTLYLAEEDGGALRLAATFATPRPAQLSARIRLGEGLIGQVALERKAITLADVPAEYLAIGSSLGAAQPRFIAAVPLLHGQDLVGVLEIAAFREFSPVELEFLDAAREGIAIGLRVGAARQRLSELLEETQQQAEELRVQQEELQQSNEELEERAFLLEQQRENIRLKSEALEAANEGFRLKAAELERVSAYKSEFLANMSHELRTPLNSLMILSSLLMENRGGNLTEKQLEYARTIHAAGTDLLNLISDILDLSKVEAGQMLFASEDIPVADLCTSLRALFAPLAEQKGLAFSVEADGGVPERFLGDEQRVHQILKNLLANALKFTERGSVELRVRKAGPGDNPLLVPALAFVVRDSGIGIPAGQHEIVFEAFRQADGSTSRKYGGTGLGLSISREFARKMHGEIRLQSREGEGSEFTLYLPLLAIVGGEAAARAAVAAGSPGPVDAAGPHPVRPALPGDRERMNCGARSVLLIEDDPDEARSMVALLEDERVAITVASTGQEALDLLASSAFDCLVLDLGLADMSGFEVLDRLQGIEQARRLPVIVHSGRELTPGDERRLRRYAESIIIKGVKSPDRLLNEVSLFLDLMQRNGRPAKPRMINTALAKESMLEGRKVLLVDDDMRNVFSLTSLLAEKGMTVVEAENGHEALLQLATHPDVSIVLMDIMMPEMDGYTAIREIRKDPRFAGLPVIAMTAKALKGDYEKCMAAGASDYIAKPIEVQKLLSLMRVWFFQHR